VRHKVTILCAAALALNFLRQGASNFDVVQQNGFEGWMPGTDPCQGWTGITCNENDRVVALCAF
jgi:hypothetical protein